MKHEHMILFRLAQLKALCQFVVAYLIALFYKRDDTIWVVSERGVDARDNGYWFFRYLRTQHPEVEAFYLISKEASDYERVKDFADHVIDYGSMRHYIMLWRASVLVSAHVQGYFPFRGLGLWLQRVLPSYRKKFHVNLKHGITKDHMSYLDYSNTHSDMIIAGVNQEYEYLLSAYGYPKKNVQLTGFCRFDGLTNQHKKRQILLMPTWREWLYKEKEFIQSEYVKKYISLLNNEDLLKLLESMNVDLIFYPHHEVQKHISVFKEKCQGKHIIIADKTAYDVQQLLVDSSLLVTDYSSVYFDFAYMRKPILFYQFDVDRYRKEQYAEGWYDYDNGLGEVVKDEASCVSLIEKSIKSDFVMPATYQAYADKMFPYRDNKNCERVYNAICLRKKNRN